MSYRDKYLKYKTKYFNLKQNVIVGGGSLDKTVDCGNIQGNEADKNKLIKFLNNIITDFEKNHPLTDLTTKTNCIECIKQIITDIEQGNILLDSTNEEPKIELSCILDATDTTCKSEDKNVIDFSKYVDPNKPADPNNSAEPAKPADPADFISILKNIIDDVYGVPGKNYIKEYLMDIVYNEKLSQDNSRIFENPGGHNSIPYEVVGFKCKKLYMTIKHLNNLFIKNSYNKIKILLGIDELIENINTKKEEIKNKFKILKISIKESDKLIVANDINLAKYNDTLKDYDTITTNINKIKNDINYKTAQIYNNGNNKQLNNEKTQLNNKLTQLNEKLKSLNEKLKSLYEKYKSTIDNRNKELKDKQENINRKVISENAYNEGINRLKNNKSKLETFKETASKINETNNNILNNMDISDINYEENKKIINYNKTKIGIINDTIKNIDDLIKEIQ
jgi:hypothetical protein